MLLLDHNPELNLSHCVPRLNSMEMSAAPNIVALGDGSLVLELPEPFSLETEDDGTICAFLTDFHEMLAVRFSSITVEAKAPKQTKDIDLAADTLARGRKENRETAQAGDKAWYHEDQDSEQDGRPIWIRFWHVGCRNSQIIISLCCDAEAKEHAQVLETLDLVPKLIAGLKWRG